MEFLPIPYSKKLIYSRNKNKKTTIGYFGDFYTRNRNIKNLYNAIESQKDKKLTICGNSDLELDSKKNIQIYDRQSIKKIREFEENIDILVCVCNIKGTQIPG